MADGATAEGPLLQASALAVKGPIIHDSHVHITPIPELLQISLEIFRRNGVDKFAVKSAGRPGSARYMATMAMAHYLGERMAFFSNLDFKGFGQPGWGEREAQGIEKAMASGASGIKIFKFLGLGLREKGEEGKLVAVNDPRLEPIWAKAGEVGAIVALHTGDPKAFFEPTTPQNERYAELKAVPHWSFHGQDYPKREELLRQRDDVIRRHAKTIFLGIHLANNPEDIDYVARILDEFPNLYVDVSARLGEIGRHPQDKVRAFFIKYQDRILFGTDLIVSESGLQLGSAPLDDKQPTLEDANRFYEAHRRFFETDLKGIDHPTPIQGNWKVNAIRLPQEVLDKFYRGNAEELIFKRRAEWVRSHPMAFPAVSRKEGLDGGVGTRDSG